MKMEQTERSETSAYKIQTPGIIQNIEYNIQTNLTGFVMQIEVELFEPSHKTVRTGIRAHQMCEKLIVSDINQITLVLSSAYS